MPTTVSGKIKVEASVGQTKTDDFGSNIVNNVSVSSTDKYDAAEGTTKIWRDQITVLGAASPTATSIDLTALTDPFGDAVAFASVHAIVVRISETSADGTAGTHAITVDCATDINVFSALLEGKAHITGKGQELVLQSTSADGPYTVDASNKIIDIISANALGTDSVVDVLIYGS